MTSDERFRVIGVRANGSRVTIFSSLGEERAREILEALCGILPFDTEYAAFELEESGHVEERCAKEAAA